MSRWRSAVRQIVLGSIFGCSLLLCSLAMAAVPQFSSASMMSPFREPVLVFGEGFNNPTISVHAGPPESRFWDARESLQRLLDGNRKLPAEPPADSYNLIVSNAKADSMLLGSPKEAAADFKILWASTSDGISHPLLINTPEIYTSRPLAPVAGGFLRIFGINFGKKPEFVACLVGNEGKIFICRTGLSYRPESNISLAFERTVVIPDQLATGHYRLFVNSGGGDYGWSSAYGINVKLTPILGTVVHCDDAPSDGVKDAGTVIQRAICKVADAGGGIVVLPAGTYLIKKTIIIDKGVKLRGAGRNATTLMSPMNAQIPQIDGRYRPVIKLNDKSSLEHLSVDAGPGVAHCAVWISKTTGASMSDCEIKNLTPCFRPDGKWASSTQVVVVTGNTHSLTVEDCVMKGELPFFHWGGEMTELTFIHNDCEATAQEGATLGLRGLRRSVIERNHIHGGGRGIVVAGEAVHSYFGFNLIERIHGLTNASEMFLYEMGHVLWQGIPADVRDRSFVIPREEIAKKQFRNDSDGFDYSAYVLITKGKGIGQCIPMAPGDDNKIHLLRPWTILPDQSSHVVLTSGCMENLHVANQFKDGVSYSGIYGSGSRNAWVGDEFDHVSDGMVLWSLGPAAPVCFNLIRDIRLQERAGILVIGERKKTENLLLAPELLGNEIRSCQIYGRERNVGNEYGIGAQVWRWPFNDKPPGNARHSSFGSEAGIHFSAINGWAGNHNDEGPSTYMSIGYSNLIWGSMTARSPIGLRVSQGFENTMIMSFTSELNGRDLSNSGKETFMAADP